MHSNKRSTRSQSMLLAALSPFQWTFAIFVITVPPYFTSNAATIAGKTYHLARLLYALYAMTLLGLTLSSSYTNTIYTTEMVDQYQLDGITDLLCRSVIFAVPFVQLLSQLTTMLGYRQLKRIFDDIEKLEHDIRWRTLLPAASAEVTFGRSFRWQLFSKSGSLLILLMGIHTSTDFLLTAPSRPMYFRLMTVFFSLLIQIKSVEFCTAVQIVQALLEQHLQELCFIRQEINAAPAALSKEHHFLYVALKSNQETLARIWKLVDAMESYFAIPMLALFLFNVLTITHTVDWAYTYQKWTPNQVVIKNYYRFIFTGVILISMLLPCWLCQSCIQTYEQFAIELHKFRSNGSDIRLSCCIREYSLQMMHQKLLFTCGGLFDINLQHFGSRVLTITTYLVILIQFKLQAEAEKAYETKMLKNMET